MRSKIECIIFNFVAKLKKYYYDSATTCFPHLGHQRYNP